MEQKQPAPFVRTLFVCCNGRPDGEDACAGRGSEAFQKELKAHMKSRGLQDRCRVSRSLCLGLCSEGPNICVMPENVWYTGVTAADLPEIREKWIDSLA